MPFITALAIYPVKGLRGIPMQAATLERQGLQHDRRWAILRPDGRVLTQRELPAMARIDAVPAPDGLRLEAAGQGGADAAATREHRQLTIWGTRVPAAAANPEASEWLTRMLGVPCTLVHLADPAARPVTPDLACPGDVVSLADGFPLLLTATESLAALNERLPVPVPMDRFRPNIVVQDAGAWAEDTWSHVDAGAVRLRLPSVCTRCAVITVDQQTGVPTPRKEPLRTLGRIRRDAEGRITFGWNAIPETLGTLRVGDPVIPVLR